MPNNELPKRTPPRRIGPPPTLPAGYPADDVERVLNGLLDKDMTTSACAEVVPITIVCVGAGYRWIS